MAQELAFQDEAFATKFLEKALAAGVRFTPDQVLEMVGAVEEVVLGKIAKRTDVPFDREQPEKIYMMIDDTSFQKISQRAKIDVFDDEPLAYGQCEQVPNIPTKKKKVGLFTALVAFVAGSALTGQVRKKHHGHCDGDCANCPPYSAMCSSYDYDAPISEAGWATPKYYKLRDLGDALGFVVDWSAEAGITVSTQ